MASDRIFKLVYFVFWLSAWPIPEGMAGPAAVVRIRGADAFAEQIARKLAVAVVKDDTKEFANGNTYVRLIDKVQGSDVIVAIPQTLTPDGLMEALIKIRTAKTSGAANVGVVTEASLDKTQVQAAGLQPLKLPLDVLFAEAGATLLREGQKPSRPLNPEQPVASSENRSSAVVFSRTHQDLARRIADKTGMMFVNKVEDIPAGAEVILVEGQAQPANLNLFRALETAWMLKSKGVPVRLIFPYLPYARSDKVDVEGTTTSGRLVADIIESTGVKSVTFVRAHAPQSQGFFKVASTNITGRPTVTSYLRSLGVEVVVAPDAGFQKDGTLYADDLKVPISIANKQRDPITGNSELKGISGEPVAGKRVVIIDDETASGGTLAKVAKLLKKLGAKEVFAVVTHITGDAKDAIQSGDLDKLIVTDTIPTETLDPSKVQVLSMAEEIAFHINSNALAADHRQCGNLSLYLNQLFP